MINERDKNYELAVERTPSAQLISDGDAIELLERPVLSLSLISNLEFPREDVESEISNRFKLD